MEDTTSIEFLIWLILLLPLLSFAFCMAGKESHAITIARVSTAVLFVTAIAACSVFLLVPGNSSVILPVEWFQVGSFSFNASLEIDYQSKIMLLVVTIISFLVHLYSTAYMKGDASVTRYFAMLGFFTFSMLGIVLANNLLVMFVFWELVGFSSYMLIGHWREKQEAGAAAQKAFLLNRIGDAGFMIGLMIIWSNTHSFDLDTILYHSEIYAWQTAASLCIFCGVIGKSAQVPLFTWLPDAMEGPTPVSALIHAATMVAAGVYLLVKVFLLFTPVSLTVVAMVGIVTAVMGALSALHQYDIKKILAYSTISQLGLMVTAVGVGAENAAMLHLFTHAFFKAGLFLAAGSVIHAVQHSQPDEERIDAQDIRNLGGLKSKLPYTFFAFIITGSSLAGIPFFSGFLSKDSILTAIYQWTNGVGSWQSIVLLLAMAVSFITVLYTFRMIWFIFFGVNNRQMAVHETPWAMRVPLIILSIGATGFVLSANPFHASGWLTQLLGEPAHETWISLVSAGWIVVACLTAWFLYAGKKSDEPVNATLQNAYQLDWAYKNLIGMPTLLVARITTAFDKKWIDGVLHLFVYSQVAFAHVIGWIDEKLVDGAVNGMTTLSKAAGSFTRSFQAGKIQLYIFWSLAALIIFLFFTLI